MHAPKFLQGELWARMATALILPGGAVVLLWVVNRKYFRKQVPGSPKPIRQKRLL